MAARRAAVRGARAPSFPESGFVLQADAVTTDSLLVGLRYPEATRVKTRLAATIGFARAAALYREWIGSVLQTMQPLRPQVRVVGFHEGAAEEAFAPWHQLTDVWWAQPPGDLGERLEEGFRRAHALGG